MSSAINKARYPDQISGRMLKYCFVYIDFSLFLFLFVLLFNFFVVP